MVQDIIDMRQNRWQARQETAGPKLLAQIREEAKRKEQPEGADRHRQSLSRGGCRRGSSGAARMPTMGEQLGRASRGTKPEKCDHSKFGSAPSAMKRDTDPATVRLGPGTGMATGNYQFLRTAKGWKIVRRGSEPAAPRSVAGLECSATLFGLLADNVGSKTLNNIIMQCRKICNHPFVFQEVENVINPSM
ncbi:hypothetical protein SeMB42_g03359 [Synchytrium endobioticum]|uniref:Uncharacterized protein n=1 Tax=Synchytrium endobioticum TaxID=286115 RepID=A0A507D795_9FUNG|nr:hypothetical protein SeMB42_g03359 [Synchytrium endobioticum]